MSKTSLVAALRAFGKAQKPPIPAGVISQLTDEVFKNITDSLVSEGKFEYPGFGTLRVRFVSEYSGLGCELW
jgi:nucleoid DNA-binding protein